MSYRHLFGRFLDADRLHFAAHSHHLWPDATYDAQAEAWQDAARLADGKWSHIFGAVIPEAQRHVARVLALPDPADIVFAPNTHELVVRLVTSLDSPVRIVTTDGEFHSFRRQVDRWVEAGIATETRVPVVPFASFPARFVEAAAEDVDLVYLSHVMFDSGYVVPDLGAIVAAVPEATEVVIDGYHGFMALPTDLGAVAGRAFYVAGGYKYAMAGEGACFMHCPPGRVMRPIDTGWFAGFGALEEAAGSVAYGTDGGRFWGATFDPAGLYRFNAVQRMLAGAGIGVEAIHDHVRSLQVQFLDGVESSGAVLGRLIPSRDEVGERGHFLTYRHPDAAEIHRELSAAGVVVDRRGDRVRIGFGLYHDAEDVDSLLKIVQTMTPPERRSDRGGLHEDHARRE